MRMIVSMFVGGAHMHMLEMAAAVTQSLRRPAIQFNAHIAGHAHGHGRSGDRCED